MNEITTDFAVFGSTPLARLLAGLLASRHGKKVVIVGEVKARYRLPRVADLSIAPITRPETWALLQAAIPETTRLIGKIGGRTAHRRVDSIFFAESPAAREALGHVANMVRAFGMVVETLPASLLGANRLALRISDAIAINRPVIEPALEAWLTQSGVTILLAPAVSFAPDGSVLLREGETEIRAAQAILADDTAITDHLSRAEWPTPLVERLYSTILTTSSRHLGSPIMADFDTGTWFVEHDEGGMAAIGPGDLAKFSQNLIALLDQPSQLQQAGQVTFPALGTADNAPLIGRRDDLGPTLLVGLDGWGAFLVPVLARHFAGEASAREAAWIKTHGPARTVPVGEFAAHADEFPA